MTPEELENKAIGKREQYLLFDYTEDEANAFDIGYIAGAKENGVKWHKVAAGDLPNGDEGYGETSIHRKIYLKDRDGNLYTGRYYPKDESHPEDCFAVEFLDWGLQGSHFCAKVQISEWCEISTFDKE